jgi:hypothetical protein
MAPNQGPCGLSAPVAAADRARVAERLRAGICAVPFQPNCPQVRKFEAPVFAVSCGRFLHILSGFSIVRSVKACLPETGENRRITGKEQGLITQPSGSMQAMIRRDQDGIRRGGATGFSVPRD